MVRNMPGWFHRVSFKYSHVFWYTGLTFLQPWMAWQSRKNPKSHLALLNFICLCTTLQTRRVQPHPIQLRSISHPGLTLFLRDWGAYRARSDRLSFFPACLWPRFSGWWVAKADTCSGRGLRTSQLLKLAQRVMAVRGPDSLRLLKTRKTENCL